MGRPKGSRNLKVTSTASAIPDSALIPPGIGIYPPYGVLDQLKGSRNVRIALYDSGYALIDLCHPGIRILARHHASLYEIAEDDLDSLAMEDFPSEILGRGFKTAPLSSIIALPGTKKL
jgi:hypothetical protein